MPNLSRIFTRFTNECEEINEKVKTKFYEYPKENMTQNSFKVFNRNKIQLDAIIARVECSWNQIYFTTASGSLKATK